jgi:hypothetical protein
MGGTGIGAIGGTGGAIQDGGGTDGACSLLRMEAKAMPLDIFILLDQSGSMVLFEDRWTPVVTAIKTFVASPEMAGVGVGLNYFGLHRQPPVDSLSPGSCDASDYARPDVPIEVLPNVQQKVIDSLNMRTPGGGTPTHPALQGAMQYVTVHASSYPDRKAVILLATDGEPQGCTGNDVTSVAQVAAAGAGAWPSITTYVIGVGPSLQTLNQVAQAGGSNQAYLVATGNTQQFLEAMKQIRGHAMGCEFSLPRGPTGQTIDLASLNLLHTPTGGGETIIYKVNRLGDCDPQLGGWHFNRDVQGNPITLELCPASCRAIVDGGGRLDFGVGCPSIPPP